MGTGALQNGVQYAQRFGRLKLVGLRYRCAGLVYQGVGQTARQMVWMDRGGKQLAVSGTPGSWGPRISPVGSRHCDQGRTGKHSGAAEHGRNRTIA
jgi:hypothetical protein